MPIGVDIVSQRSSYSGSGFGQHREKLPLVLATDRIDPAGPVLKQASHHQHDLAGMMEHLISLRLQVDSHHDNGERVAVTTGSRHLKARCLDDIVLTA